MLRVDDYLKEYVKQEEAGTSNVDWADPAVRAGGLSLAMSLSAALTRGLSQMTAINNDPFNNPAPADVQNESAMLKNEVSLGAQTGSSATTGAVSLHP